MGDVLKAIERIEEIYGELCDEYGMGATLETAAHLASIECGVSMAVLRGYIATRRHLQRMEPERGARLK